MTALTYREQLLNPKWQRKRLEVLQRDGFTCRRCGDKESTLHVHHKQYVKGRMAWEYPDSDLVTLCEDCHGLAGEEMGQMRALLARLHPNGPCDSSSTLALVAGWASYVHADIELSNDAPWGMEPGAFIAGQLAALIDAQIDIDALLALLSAMRDVPRWVASSVLLDAAEHMRSRKEEPPPPSLLADGLGDL